MNVAYPVLPDNALTYFVRPYYEEYCYERHHIEPTSKSVKRFI